MRRPLDPEKRKRGPEEREEPGIGPKGVGDLIIVVDDVVMSIVDAGADGSSLDETFGELSMVETETKGPKNGGPFFSAFVEELAVA